MKKLKIISISLMILLISVLLNCNSAYAWKESYENGDTSLPMLSTYIFNDGMFKDEYDLQADLDDDSIQNDIAAELTIFQSDKYKLTGEITYNREEKTLVLNDLKCDSLWLTISEGSEIETLKFTGENRVSVFAAYKDTKVKVEGAENATLRAQAYSQGYNHLEHIELVNNTTMEKEEGTNFDLYRGSASATEKIVKDEETGIVAKTISNQNIRLVVNKLDEKDENYSALKNELQKDANIVGSYEVKIEGKYQGKIKINFPVDEKYNGMKATVLHKKSDNQIEKFDTKVENNQIEVEVDELSPFMIAIAKSDDVGNKTQSGASNQNSSSQDLDKSPKTGDNNNILIVSILSIITLGAIIIEIKK